MLLYSAYKKLKKPYIILNSKSYYYKECIRRGFSYYNVSSISTKSLNTLIREEERLKLEREAAFCSIVKSIARIDCL
jgi:hypothetical protein